MGSIVADQIRNLRYVNAWTLRITEPVYMMLTAGPATMALTEADFDYLCTRLDDEPGLGYPDEARLLEVYARAIKLPFDGGPVGLLTTFCKLISYALDCGSGIEGHWPDNA